jgi:type IV pilus assembly protein PilN
MVRINLLPDRRQAGGFGMTGAEPEQLWLFGGISGSVVLAIVVCLFVQKFKQDELAAIIVENQRTQGQIDQVRAQIADHGAILGRLKELRDREDAIMRLQNSRIGPTQVLLELSRLLTSGRGPTGDRDRLEQLRRDNPAEAFNPGWDVRRVWITSYNETDRNLKLSGMARDGDDVSEFERRLKQSDFFSDVRLLPGDKVSDKAGSEVFRFDLSARTRY